MEENEYRQAYHNLNPNPCVFEKAILNNRGDCVQCQRINLAEREGVACLSPRGTILCADLLKQLRQKARFALKLSRLQGPLPHTKELKVQGGGLLGLQAMLNPDLRDVKQVGNINALVNRALTTFEEFEKLPYQEIVKFVSGYQVRMKNRYISTTPGPSLVRRGVSPATPVASTPLLPKEEPGVVELNKICTKI